MFANTIKIVGMFFKNNLYKLKKIQNQKLCIKIQSISLFLVIEKLADFRGKNTDVRINHGVCHAIYIFFVFSLGKVQLCQVSSL